MKKKSKTPLRLKIVMGVGMLIMLLGVGIVLYPIVANLIAEHDQESAIVNYKSDLEKMTKQDLDYNWNYANKYNEYIRDVQEGIATQKAVPYEGFMKGEPTIASLDVPSIKLKDMPIYHGTSYVSLSKGLGHLKYTSLPVGGKSNYSVISGHSGVQNAVLFSNLEKVQKGDVFYVHVLRKTLAYQVFRIRKVNPSDSNAVKIIPGEDITTLLTCWPIGINNKRLLVEGKRIPYEQAKKVKTIDRGFWNYQTIVLSVLGFLFLIWLLSYLLRKRKKNKQKQVGE